MHEYGHFVASVLTRRAQVDGLFTTVVPGESLLLTAGAEVPANQAHGHELFADAFAVLVCGPAYVRYCMRYRFDLESVHQSTGTHPPPSRRVRLQLDMLEQMAGDDGPGGFLTSTAKAMRERWAARLAASGTVLEPPSDPEVDELTSRVMRLVLTDPTLARIRYQHHRVAGQIAEQDLCSAPAGSTAAHLLNAAWTRRESVETAGHPATTTARNVARIDQAVRALWQGVLPHA
jgi:hypothetical protein